MFSLKRRGRTASSRAHINREYSTKIKSCNNRFIYTSTSCLLLVISINIYWISQQFNSFMKFSLLNPFFASSSRRTSFSLSVPVVFSPWPSWWGIPLTECLRGDGRVHEVLESFPAVKLRSCCHVAARSYFVRRVTVSFCLAYYSLSPPPVTHFLILYEVPQGTKCSMSVLATLTTQASDFPTYSEWGETRFYCSTSLLKVR